MKALAAVAEAATVALLLLAWWGVLILAWAVG